MSRWGQTQQIVLFVVIIACLGIWLMTRPLAVPMQHVLQAGWKIQHQQPIYSDTASPFQHPPLVALLASPFGMRSNEPTNGLGMVLVRAGWFLLNAACLLYALNWLTLLFVHEQYEDEQHVVAKLGRSLALPSKQMTSWLMGVLLVVPLLLTLNSGTPVGIQLLLITMMLASLLHNQSFAGGLALAGLMFLDVTCVLLLCIPIAWRDRLLTYGIVLGMTLFLLVLPGWYFGLHETNRLNGLYLHIVQLQFIAALNSMHTIVMLVMALGSVFYLSTVVGLCSITVLPGASLMLLLTSIVSTPLGYLNSVLLLPTCLLIMTWRIHSAVELGLRSGLLLFALGFIVVAELVPGLPALTLAPAITLWMGTLWLHRQTASRIDSEEVVEPLKRAA